MDIKVICRKVCKHADTPVEIRHTKHMLAVGFGMAIFLPEWAVVPYTTIIAVIQLYKL